MLRRTTVALALVSTALLAMTGCTATVSKSALEKGISNQIAQKYGDRPGKVSCPKDLTGKVGTKMHCTITGANDGKAYDTLITVTSAKGTKIGYTINVSSQGQ